MQTVSAILSGKFPLIKRPCILGSAYVALVTKPAASWPSPCPAGFPLPLSGRGNKGEGRERPEKSDKNPGQYWDKPAVAPAVVFIAKGAPQVHEHSCAGGILGVTAMCVRLTDACDFTAD